MKKQISTISQIERAVFGEPWAEFESEITFPFNESEKIKLQNLLPDNSNSLFTGYSDNLQLHILRKIDAALEAERSKLARELHDQMGQDLVALDLGLRALKGSVVHDAEAGERLKHLQNIVLHLGHQLHEIASDLRPMILDDLGLQNALFSLVERWSQNAGISVDFNADGLKNCRLDRDVETAIYRIVQECLTNVSKHARAGNVKLTLQHLNRQLLITVIDDGNGFNQCEIGTDGNRSKRLGLLGIRERVEMVGGEFEIKSSVQKGTTVTVSIPLSD